jgi:hypothetical protein
VGTLYFISAIDNFIGPRICSKADKNKRKDFAFDILIGSQQLDMMFCDCFFLGSCCN